jgi:hypothetical protein
MATDRAPLGAVPKKDGDFRVIVDSTANGINANSSAGKNVMPTMNQYLRVFLEACNHEAGHPKAGWISGLDKESAYPSVPIRFEDYHLSTLSLSADANFYFNSPVVRCQDL